MKGITLNLEVAGCNTTCMHCWANGRQYTDMQLSDFEYVANEFREFCTKNGYKLMLNIMHEPLGHSQIVEVLKSVKKNLVDYDYKNQYEPIPTSGVPIATREDWREVLENVRELGTNTLWFTFHGIGETHDKLVNRKGAFKELCTAIERVQSIGYSYGCNVFITKDNTKQLTEIKELLTKMKFNTVIFGVAEYDPSKRAEKYNLIRPDLDDLLPSKDDIIEMSPSWNRKMWNNLENYTEAAYYKLALNNELPHPFSTKRDDVWLICKKDFGIYNGNIKSHSKFYGNLKDDKEAVFTTLLEDIENGNFFRETPSMYYGIDKIPTIKELAQEYGNPNGRKIYPSSRSMMFKWLEIAFGNKSKY